jgi:transcriptional regulator GlxA family with amidase domain
MARQRKQSSVREEQRLQAFIAAAPHKVSIVVFPGAGPFDVAAVAEIFSTANGQLKRERGIERNVYAVEIVGPSSSAVELEMGLKIVPDRTLADPIDQTGTLVLSGGCWEPLAEAVKNRVLINWIKRAAAKAERVAAMCTGSFLLSEAGLAKTTVTTHWAQCDRMREMYPQLKVEADNIYVKEGNIYSSAGSTAAMDLTLALIEEDLGRALAMNVARRMVMFLKRPGGQSQFSTALLAQTAESDSLRGVPEWIANNLDADLSVEALAARAGMSPRNFARVFLAETGLTPAKYVERARLERARQLIEDTGLPLTSVAGRAGFESDQQMRRTFVRWLAVTPADYVDRFGKVGGDTAFAVVKTTTRNGFREAQPWLP